MKAFYKELMTILKVLIKSFWEEIVDLVGRFRK